MEVREKEEEDGVEEVKEGSRGKEREKVQDESYRLLYPVSEEILSLLPYAAGDTDQPLCGRVQGEKGLYKIMSSKRCHY